MRDINFDLLELSALVESLTMRVENLASLAQQDTHGKREKEITREASDIIKQRIEASTTLQELLDEVKVIGGLPGLQEYAKSMGIIGRALHGDVDMLLLEHGDIFILAVEEHLPNPPKQMRFGIFHKILKMQNESLEEVLQRESFIREMKDLKQNGGFASEEVEDDEDE